MFINFLQISEFNLNKLHLLQKNIKKNFFYPTIICYFASISMKI